MKNITTPKTAIEAYNVGQRDTRYIRAGCGPQVKMLDQQPANIQAAYWAGRRSIVAEAAPVVADPAHTTRADQYNVWTCEGTCEASLIRYTDGRRVNLRGSRAARFMHAADELPRGASYEAALHALCVATFAEASA